jgi:hypothetical protein
VTIVDMSWSSRLLDPVNLMMAAGSAGPPPQSLNTAGRLSTVEESTTRPGGGRIVVRWQHHVCGLPNEIEPRLYDGYKPGWGVARATAAMPRKLIEAKQTAVGERRRAELLAAALSRRRPLTSG